jgi:acyl carrier protein
MSVHDYLKALVLELSDVDEGDIDFDASFENLGLDSLAFVEMGLSISKEYGVKISPDLFVSGKIKNLNELADYISTTRPSSATDAERVA